MKQSLSRGVQRALTGFAAGVMTAASVWSLLIPAIEQSEEKMGRLAFLPAAVGFLAGIGFLLLLDRLIPHLHMNSDKAEGIKAKDADIEIGISIVSDDEILELNREYREKDSVTDVLSFPQFDGLEDIAGAILMDEEASVLLGDVVICYDQAMRQAKEYGTGTTRELLYLFVHSVMHLMGYDHIDEEDKKIMRAHEEAVLEAIGVKRV